MTTRIAFKCLACGLHANLYTWDPGRHNAGTLYCPECGQHSGRFIVWSQKDAGQVYEHVPGNAVLLEAPRKTGGTVLVGPAEEEKKVEGEDLDEVFLMAWKHGNMEGSEAEASDLQDVLREAWSFLGPAARAGVLSSRAVSVLREVVDGDEG